MYFKFGSLTSILYFLGNCATLGSAATPLARTVYNECEIEKSGCKMQVELSCTYKRGGDTKNCLTPTGEYDKDKENTPFRTIDSNLCGSGSNPTVNAKLKYRICNDNNVPMSLDKDETFLKYKGTAVDPETWTRNLPANTCRLHEETVRLDLCETSRMMIVQMQGSLIRNQNNNYCRCFMRQKITSAIGGNPPSSPTRSPSESPSEIVPTESPTKVSQTDPKCKDDDSYNFGIFEGLDGSLVKRNCAWLTKVPRKEEQRKRNWCDKYIGGKFVKNACISTCENCDNVQEPEEKFCSNDSDVVISEITDPYDNDYGRYIELYFYNCGGKVIRSDLKVLRWGEGKYNPSKRAVNLRGVKIREDGFITICSFSEANELFERDTCTVSGSTSNPIIIRGTSAYAVVKGSVNSYQIIDAYGKTGLLGQNSNQDFTGGRAVRDTSAITASRDWDTDEWLVFPGNGKQLVGVDGLDPNEWKYARPEVKATLIITEIIDPNDADGDVPRYVELYAPMTRDRGQATKDDLKLVVFHSDSKTPDFRTAIFINYIPENGFITACNVVASAMLGDKCTIVRDELGGPVDSNGNDQIAIISGDESHYYVTDIFGVIGEDGTDTAHDFKDSRVVRNQNVIRAKPTWSRYDWTIQSTGFYAGDPNEWEDADVQRYAPSVSPSSPPTYDGRDCDLIITELTNPLNNPNAGYIELQSNCPEDQVHGPVKIVTWRLGRVAELSLQGFTIPNDGFIIICKDKSIHRNAYNYLLNHDQRLDAIAKSKCDIENSDIVSDGSNPVAIIKGDVEDGKFIDNYGFPGSSLYGTDFLFRDGRAVRHRDAISSKAYFDPSIWEINPPGEEYASTVDVDPREWVGVALKLYFTEFCDPRYNPLGRYIELYSPNKRDYTIKEDIIIIKFEKDSHEPIQFERLMGKKINKDGFLVLCRNYYAWEEKCDYVLGDFSVADNNGLYDFALSKCPFPDASCYDIDAFGDFGSKDFQDGRAVRKKSPFVKGSPVFDESDWYISSNSGSKMCDPGEWNYMRRDDDDHDDDRNDDDDDRKDDDDYDDDRKDDDDHDDRKDDDDDHHNHDDDDDHHHHEHDHDDDDDDYKDNYKNKSKGKSKRRR